jgi:hypothetical protein
VKGDEALRQLFIEGLSDREQELAPAAPAVVVVDVARRFIRRIR